MLFRLRRIQGRLVPLGSDDPPPWHIVPALWLVLGAGFVHAAPFTAGNLLVGTRGANGSHTPQLIEMTLSGTTVQSVPIPQPGDGDPRDLVVDSQGRVQVFNGTFDPYLSTYDPTSGLWMHHTYPGWSIINNTTYGGIAVSGSSCFVTDQATFGPGDLPSGIVRFDLQSFSGVRFADGADYIDLNLGLDGLLYALGPSGSPGGTTLSVYDPSTQALIRTLSLSSRDGLRAIAVDAAGTIFAVGLNSGVYRYDHNGAQRAHIDTYSLFSTSDYLEDIDVRQDGKLAIGTDCGGIGVADETLSPGAASLKQLLYCFSVWVTFVPGMGATTAGSTSWGQIKSRYR